MLANLKLSSEVHPGRDFYFLILQNKNRPPLPRNAPLINQLIFLQKGVILAKKPTGGLTRGEKKKIKSKNGQKNILDDLQGVKRRKIQEKMAKYPTGGLTRGERNK